ncbi:hypothetical protein Hanom_Chr17g01588011 [Helianthus anomalus]
MGVADLVTWNQAQKTAIYNHRADRGLKGTTAPASAVVLGCRKHNGGSGQDRRSTTIIACDGGVNEIQPIN